LFKFVLFLSKTSNSESFDFLERRKKNKKHIYDLEQSSCNGNGNNSKRSQQCTDTAS